MYNATRSLTAATLLLATATSAACVKTEDNGSNGTPVVQTTPAEPLVPVSNKTAPVSVGGTGVSSVPTYNTGADAYKAGRYRDAAEMYKVHVGASPTDAQGYYMLGLSTWKAGFLKDAKDAFDKSIELNPKFSKSYFNQARVLLDMKRAPEAFEMVDRGLGLDSNSSDGWRLKARAQSEKGDVEGAMMTYKELLIRNDADAWGLNNFGSLLIQKGEFHDAIGPLSRAVQVQPTSPLFQNNLGMALERSGFKVVALRHYELAVKNDSMFTKAVKNAERLKGVLPDSAKTVEIDVPGVAEQFRLQVKEWKQKVPKGEVKPADLK
jgi:tetratricopeptide (TPR) repeat protein